MVREGYHSISDLYSSEYLRYINNPKNLIHKKEKEKEKTKNKDDIGVNNENKIIRHLSHPTTDNKNKEENSYIKNKNNNNTNRKENSEELKKNMNQKENKKKDKNKASSKKKKPKPKKRNEGRRAKITVNNLLNNKKLPAQEIIKHISQEIGTEYEKEKNKMKLKVKEILNGTYHEPSQNETIEDISNDIVDLIINEQSEKNNENDIFENENSDDEKNVKEEKEEEKNEKKEEKRRRRKGKINQKDKGYLSNANSKNVKTILKNKII